VASDRRAARGAVGLLAVLAFACAGPGPRGPVDGEVSGSVTIAGGDPVAGAEVFTRECASCHTTVSATPGIGPSLSMAGMRFNVDYIRQSILHPGQYEAGEHSPGVMPRDLGQRLTDEEIEDVVAYVAALR